METTTWKGGGIPFGYAYENKKLIADKWVRNVFIMIYNLALKEKLSAREIARRLNERGFKGKRGKAWSYKTVAYLFTPEKIEFYSGFRDGAPGDWEPLITQDMAKKLILLKTVSTAAPRPRKNKFLLPGLGICYCGLCGGPIKSAQSKMKNNEANFYYFCSNKAMYSNSKCPSSRLHRQDIVDGILLDNILNHSLNIPALKRYNEKYIKVRNSGLETELAELSVEMSNLNKQKTSAKSSEQLKEITVRIVALSEKQTKLIEEKLSTFDFTDLRNLHRLSIENKRIGLLALVKNISLFNDYMDIEYHFPIDDSGKKNVRFSYE
jgi:hypothetical protein